MLAANGAATAGSAGFHDEEKAMMIRNYADEERQHNPIDQAGAPPQPKRSDIGKSGRVGTGGPEEPKKYSNGTSAR